MSIVLLLLEYGMLLLIGWECVSLLQPLYLSFEFLYRILWMCSPKEREESMIFDLDCGYEAYLRGYLGTAVKIKGDTM